MIIQCQKCLTRFRLADSKVTDRGVKVRCTKCKNVFTVQKEEPEAESCEPAGALTGVTSPAEQVVAPGATHEERSVVPEPFVAAPFDSDAFEDTSLRSEPADFSSIETATFDASAMPFESDGGDSDGSETAPTAAYESAAREGEVDFSGFDFGGSDPEPNVTSLSNQSVDGFGDTTTEMVPAASQKEAPQGFDFSDDGMFGAVVQTAPEASSTTNSFDFGGGSVAESMDMKGQDSSDKSGSLFSLDASGEEPFNPGEFDFGDERPSAEDQQVTHNHLKPSKEILFAPLAEDQDKPAADELARSFSREGSDDDQQELPPLSIASRRKRSPIFGALIAVIAVLVISVLGYLGYTSISTSRETAAPETGKISVRAVKAAFMKNGTAGELLVISGEALNEYPKPRAALQVKVTVFDAAGQSIATKSAYGGNPLTKEQLESLPLEKIEAAMANQFGDSLANMEVAPGKAIPFVIVLAHLPNGSKDYAVQSAGSTVATGKQQ